jgi:phospholipase C
VLLLALVAGCGGASPRETPAHSAGPHAGIHKIRHVIVIMQENRSFDHYFGTYPGADGLPRQKGTFAVCVPDTYLHRCIKPYHDHRRRNIGGTHQHAGAIADIDGGRMDGFITQARRALKNGCEAHARSALCQEGHGSDVLG